MKLSTLAIAFGPAVLVIVAKTALDPAWLKEWSIPACIALGALIGGFGVIAARTLEPRD